MREGVRYFERAHRCAAAGLRWFSAYAIRAYPELLKMPRRRAKSVLSSGLLVVHGAISGLYFPFFCGGQRQPDIALGHWLYLPCTSWPTLALPEDGPPVHRVSGGNHHPVSAHITRYSADNC